MDWDAPAIILSVRPFGEGDALATVLTEAHGPHRGLAKGGASRSKSGLWQPGNLAQVRWTGRLADQLGAFTAEMVHATAARAMPDPLSLAILASACAVADGAVPEREPHPRVFGELLHLLATLDGADSLALLIRWEAALLADLGYGLDLTGCAISGATAGLAWVSLRTGRAVADEAAGAWRDRLLPLPALLLPGTNDTAGTPEAWRDGLRLTAHFLARDAFGHTHKPLPPARLRLADRVDALAAEEASKAGLCPDPPKA